MVLVTAAALLLALHVVSLRLGALLLVAAVALEGAEKRLWWRLRRLPARTGAEAMLGARVTSLCRCAPEGRVRYGPELWRALCPTGAAPGEELVIQAVDGLTLLVARPVA